MAETSIEWATRVWNPVVGCTAVSPGCENCYAEKLAARHVLMSAARGLRSPYLRVVVDVRVERLVDITAEDCAREGFPELTPLEFCEFYMRAGKGRAVRPGGGDAGA